MHHHVTVVTSSRKPKEASVKETAKEEQIRDLATEEIDEVTGGAPFVSMHD
jgi:hypothetical protein